MEDNEDEEREVLQGSERGSTLAQLCLRRVVELVGEESESVVGADAWGRLPAWRWERVLAAAARRKGVGDGVLCALARATPPAPALRVLVLAGAGARVTDAGLRALASAPARCAALEVLDLSKCAACTAAGVSTLLRACPALRELVLVRTPAASDALLCSGALPPALHTLDVSRAVRVTDAGLRALAGAQCSTTLARVVLLGCARVTDAGVGALLAACPALRALSLARCARVTDAALVPALARPPPFARPPLTLLSVARCRALSRALLSPLARALAACPALTHLDLASAGLGSTRDPLNTQALVQFFSSLKVGFGRHGSHLDAIEQEEQEQEQHIEILYLADCPAVTDEVVEAVSDALHTSLRRLYLSECVQVTSRGVGSVLSRCHALEVLNIARCAAVDDAAFTGPDAGVQRELPCNLATLNLSHCIRLGERTAAALAALPSLTWLEAAGCGDLVDDGALHALARPALQFVDLSGCARVSDAGVAALTAAPHGCTRLRWLTLAQTGLSARGLAAALAHGRHLELLNLTACPAVTPAALAAVLRACPVLTRLDCSKCPGLYYEDNEDEDDSKMEDDDGVGGDGVDGEEGRMENNEMQNDKNDKDDEEGVQPVDWDETTMGDSFEEEATTGTTQPPAAHRMLETVHVAGAGRLRGEVVGLLGRLPCLRSLTLCGARNVGAAALRHVLARCTELQYVNLSGCTAVSDAALAALPPRTAARLTALVLEGCARVTDAGAARIISAAAALEELNLSGCVRVTNASVGLLRDPACCPHLLALCLCDCRVAVSLLRDLAALRPHLAIRFKGARTVAAPVSDDPDRSAPPPSRRSRQDPS